MSYSLEVDFTVYKELTYRRESETDTYNSVIRRLLSLPPVVNAPHSVGDGRPLLADGVRFPHGAEFRLKHKGTFHYGKVEDGELVVDGKRFTSVSAAGVHVTGTSVNGWRMWWCKRPGDNDYVSIDQLRGQRGA